MDITDEKQVLERLNQSVERMRLAEMAASFGIWEMDLASGIVKGSEAWAALEGVSDANVGRHVDEVREIVHPDDRWLLASGAGSGVRHGRAVFGRVPHRARARDHPMAPQHGAGSVRGRTSRRG